jgi:hypothetical protein
MHVAASKAVHRVLRYMTIHHWLVIDLSLTATPGYDIIQTSHRDSPAG